MLPYSLGRRVAILSLSLMLALACGPPAVLAQIPSGTGTLTADSAEVTQQGIFDTPPEVPDDVGEGEEKANPSIQTPIDPDFRPEQMTPETSPTSIERSGTGAKAGAEDAEPKASGDYSVFRNSNVSSDPAGTPRASSTTEPSLGMDGRVVFYTANWLAGFSGDAGQTFDYVNPFDNFPPDGTMDNPSNAGTFCCDQIAYYEPSRGIMIWLLQYTPSGNDPSQDTNIQRLAIANSQQDVINNNWYWIDLTPGNLGYSSTGKWLDFPSMAVSNNHLYVTTNVFDIGSNSTSNSVVVRIPLDDLASGGNISFRYWQLDRPTPRPTQGAGSTMYFGTHYNNTTLRVFYNDENSTSMNYENVNHDGYSTSNMSASCDDGSNLGGNSDDRVLGAWRSEASGDIGFMWNAGAGGDFPHPHVRVVRTDPSNWPTAIATSDQEISIWSQDHAFLYPSVHVNDRGHLGGTIGYGCGNYKWPGTAAFALDDYNNFPDLTGFKISSFAYGNDAPNDNRWGDYLTTRRMSPFGNTWVGTGMRLDGGGGDGDSVPEFIWFGRERDMPPSSRTIFVDLNYSGSYETGTSSRPYNTVGEGEFALMPDDKLRIHGGSYLESVLFDTRSDVDNESGTGSVVIE